MRIQSTNESGLGVREVRNIFINLFSSLTRRSNNE